MTAAESTYVPIIHPMELDEADGVSSSEARKRLVLGTDLTGILLPSVVRYATGRRLYFPPANALEAEAHFLEGYRRFVREMSRRFPGVDYDHVGMPEFKPTQSQEG